MPAEEPDTIRMTVPSNPDLAPVVQVATAVLARRADLSDEQVATARAAVATAFTELAAGAGAGPAVDVELRVDATTLSVRLVCGRAERSFRAP